MKSLDQVSRAALRKHPRHAAPVPTSVCDACGETFGGCAVVREDLAVLHRSLEGCTGALNVIPLGTGQR